MLNSFELIDTISSLKIIKMKWISLNFIRSFVRHSIWLKSVEPIKWDLCCVFFNTLQTTQKPMTTIAIFFSFFFLCLDQCFCSFVIIITAWSSLVQLVLLIRFFAPSKFKWQTNVVKRNTFSRLHRKKHRRNIDWATAIWIWQKINERSMLGLGIIQLIICSWNRFFKWQTKPKIKTKLRENEANRNAKEKLKRKQRQWKINISGLETLTQPNKR